MKSVTGLLQANDKELLMTKFFQTNKPVIEACIYLVPLPNSTKLSKFQSL